MNNRTRVLSTKSVDLDSMKLDQLRDYSMALIDGIDTKAHRPITIATFKC